MARDIASTYKADIDPEHMPASEEYAAIASSLCVTLDIDFFYSGDFVHFQINSGCDHVVRVLWTGSGGSVMTESKGHFDYIFLEQPDLSPPVSGEPQHGGFGV
jgi:hypothetical protein